MSDLPDDEPQQLPLGQPLPLEGPAPEPADPDREAEEQGAYEDYEAEGERAYTTSEFHNIIQKQILNATYETLAETKLHWELVQPFLDAARDMCRGDFVRTGRLEVHGVVADGEHWQDAEEAYLSVSIADQDDGREWLSETWWLSDVVLAGGDPARVREGAAAIARSLERINAWLAEHGQAKGPDDGGI
jgi:hypothetical protein